MSAVAALNIVLQHDIDEQYQYQPGEIVRGNIILKLSKSAAIRTITVKVYGEGNVSWKDEDENVYQAQEIFVDAATAVVDTINFEPLRLNSGMHEFQFDYILPNNIPSSYIGKYGNVTYTMKVAVNGVKSVDAAISSEPFLVLRRAPLPVFALQNLSLEAEKRMWASCTFGKLYVSVILDKQGGVPGEDLILKAEIKNQTRRMVTAMQASLVMTSTYRAQNHSTEFRQVVSKKRDEFDVGYMEGRRWTYARLQLPPYIPESKLEFCDIIEMEYQFQFRVEMSGGSEVRLETPFWVGAQPQGLEIPRDERAKLKIDRQWTVRGSKNAYEELNGNSEPKLDYDDGWGVEVVPELRTGSAVITNPLFGHSAFPQQKPVRVLPEELIENTKL